MHNHCEHDMAHCGKCDVAYCAKCSKEWGANSTYTPLDYIITTTDAGNTSNPLYVTSCSHAAGV